MWEEVQNQLQCSRETWYLTYALHWFEIHIVQDGGYFMVPGIIEIVCIY